MPLDLAQFDTTSKSSEGAVMEVRHPATNKPLTDDAGKPMTIRLAGSDSERYRAAQRIVQNRRLADIGKRRGGKITAEELEDEGLTILAQCTLDWSGIVIDGEALKCTSANAKRVYERFPWLREQVDDFVNERANFLHN